MPFWLASHFCVKSEGVVRRRGLQLVEKFAENSNRSNVALAKFIGFAASLIGSAYLVGLAQHEGNSILGWFALLPLFHAIRVLSPGRAFGAGALWGISALAFGLLRAPVHVNLFAYGSLMALIPALYAAYGSRLTRKVGFSPYLLALGWIGVEFALRPLGMHNGLLAGTLGDQGFFVHVIGSFAGYVLVAFLVAYFNAALLAALSSATIPGGGRRIARSSTGPQRGVFASEVPFHSAYLIAPSRPRAPPISALTAA
jgi:apolipoprotein N-acyltransferase